MESTTGTININTILALVSLFISVLTIATVIYNAATRLARIEQTATECSTRLRTAEGLLDTARGDIVRLTVKVDTMWAFQMRRAVSEAVSKGIADMNSPLTFHTDILHHLDPIAPELRDWGDKHKHLNQGDFLVGLEAYFGADLLTRFSIPLGVSHGACLLAAMQKALNVPQLDLTIYDPDIERRMFDVSIDSTQSEVA